MLFQHIFFYYELAGIGKNEGNWTHKKFDLEMGPHAHNPSNIIHGILRQDDGMSLGLRFLSPKNKRDKVGGTETDSARGMNRK